MTGDLIRQGVVLDGRQTEGGAANPAYLFTRLGDIRPAMLAQATKSARALAQQFATDSNSHLGAIRRASEGVFQVMSRDGEVPESDRRARVNRKKVAPGHHRRLLPGGIISGLLPYAPYIDSITSR